MQDISLTISSPLPHQHPILALILSNINILKGSYSLAIMLDAIADHISSCCSHQHSRPSAP